jgi:triosephosphate isomerase
MDEAVAESATASFYKWTGLLQSVCLQKKLEIQKRVTRPGLEVIIMSRTPFIAGNWKMNKTMAEAAEFADAFKKQEIHSKAKMAFCVPFTDLAVVKKAFEGTEVGVGAQNVHFEDSGAFTGEVSLPMLKEIGLDYCIIGHSERRQYFHETDESCNKKLKKLLNESSIIPILCVGENLDEREAGKEEEVVSSEIKADFEGIPEELAEKVVIAYEPIWAIGTGKTAGPEQAEEMCGFIRRTFASLYSQEAADKLIIQYGGSMKPENAEALLAEPDIDGGLIGGASLVPEKFAAILNAAK